MWFLTYIQILSVLCLKLIEKLTRLLQPGLRSNPRYNSLCLITKRCKVMVTEVLQKLRLLIEFAVDMGPAPNICAPRNWNQ